MSHGRTVCVCGKVLSSCRCPGPHMDFKQPGPCVCCVASEPIPEQTAEDKAAIASADKQWLRALTPEVIAVAEALKIADALASMPEWKNYTLLATEVRRQQARIIELQSMDTQDAEALAASQAEADALRVRLHHAGAGRESARATIAALTRKVTGMTALLAGVIEDGPYCDDEGSCFFCQFQPNDSEELEHLIAHKPDCKWRVAKEALGRDAKGRK